MKLRVKVCGITRLQDALCAAELGADALGFNFAPESPRRIEAAEARRIRRALPPFIACIGVVTNATPEELAHLASEAALDGLQFHGEETPADCAASPLPWFKAFRTGPGFDPGDLATYAADVHLVDAFRSDARGGTGQVANWDAAAAAARQFKIVLAGGLGAENVIEAVEAVAPAGVDVNSAVESSPGVKDAEKLSALFTRLAARGYR